MIRLFQIGDIRLYNTLNNLVVPRAIASFAQSSQMVWSPQKIFGFGGYGMKSQPFSLKEAFVGNHYHTLAQRVSLFANLIARPIVDIIGYIDMGECPDGWGVGSTTAFDDNTLWLHTLGTVMSVDPSYTGNTLNIKLDIQPLWEPINRYLWEFTPPSYTNTLVSTPAANAYDDLSALPFLYTLDAQYSWNRKFYSDDLYMFDPDVWEYWHDRLPVGFPATGVSRNWTTNPHFSFTVSREWWPGPPRSLYQWTNLPSTGSLEIEITTQDPLWGSETTTASCHLGILDQLLADNGYTGLQTTDILVIADYKGMRSFIIRSGALIEDVYPQWTYSSDSLGQAGHGYNLIKCTFPVNTVQWCQLHNYRIM